MREQPTNLASQPLLDTSNRIPSRNRLTNPFATRLIDFHSVSCSGAEEKSKKQSKAINANISNYILIIVSIKYIGSDCGFAYVTKV